MFPRLIVGLLLTGLGKVGSGGFDLENESCLREGDLGVDSFHKFRETNGRGVWWIQQAGGLCGHKRRPYGGAGEGIEE